MKQDALTGWALARLAGGAEKSKLEKLGALDELTQRFGLDGTGRELLALAWAAERSLEVAKAGRALAGASARAITVEVAREAVGRSLDAILAANAPLRRSALVVLDTAGPALATSELRLGAGVAARLEGTPLELDGFAPGVRAVRAPLDAKWLDRFPANAKVAEVVKDRLVSIEGLLATVDVCGRRDAWALALGAAKRFSRGLVAVDGELMASFHGRWELLAALRREADLEGMVLLVTQAASLGEAWRALAAPPLGQSARPPLVVLADSAQLREITLVEGLRHQAISLNAPLDKPVAEAPKDDPYEQIRRQAQRDAERALGILRPVEPPPRAAQPANVVEAAKVAAPKPAEAAKVEAPKPVEASKPVEAPKAEAAPPVEEKPKKSKRSKKAIEHFGPDPEDVAAAPTPAPAETPAPPPAAVLESNAPYLPVSDKPSLDELSLVARTSPNPQQRVDAMTALKGLKSQAVIQAFRENAKSEHPLVRAMAEEGMASLFGPNWNRTRAVTKPVQPPLGEDKNPNRPW